MKRTSTLIVAMTLLLPAPVLACTNFLITRGASSDGSTMITYAADSHTLYGALTYSAAAEHLPGTWREVIEWDTGKRLGLIPQVSRTYAVVGNMNEHQVSVGETTFGGRAALVNPDGVLDYGSLMYIALERARTAREAITVMTSLAEKYGYSSAGESFSVADPKEVWILELVGTGKGGKGALWVARRIPDGFVSGHANQARIRRFPLNDRRDTLYAKDVIAFARRKGWFKGPDSEFSFADTYAPLTWFYLRICEARVWSMFRRVNKGAQKYVDWIKGQEGAEPLPLWIKPDSQVSAHQVMELMRDHFEGTPFDMRHDVGAGPYRLPYRFRPLEWYADPACDKCAKEKDAHKKKTCLAAKRCVKYFNERATATQQTGFSFVAQARSWLPSPIGGLFWFGVDDVASSVYVPMYAGILRPPTNYAVGNGDFKTFSWDSAFWVFNVVANFAYSRYRDMIQDIRRVQQELEGSFFARQPEVEQRALWLHRQSPLKAREYLTQYSADQASNTVTRWRHLLTELLLKYLDGNVRDAQGNVTHPGYPKKWYRRLVREKGERFRERKLKNEPPEEIFH